MQDLGKLHKTREQKEQDKYNKKMGDLATKVLDVFVEEDLTVHDSNNVIKIVQMAINAQIQNKKLEEFKPEI